MKNTKIENYCGKKGYIAGTNTRLEALERDGITYLIDSGLASLDSNQTIYRIHKVDEASDTAVAVPVTDSKLIQSIERELIESSVMEFEAEFES